MKVKFVLMAKEKEADFPLFEPVVIGRGLLALGVLLTGLVVNGNTGEVESKYRYILALKKRDDGLLLSVIARNGFFDILIGRRPWASFRSV